MKTNKERKKEFKQLLRKKKHLYVKKRRMELIALDKQNPKKLWKEIQQKRRQTNNNIIGSQWLEYAKKFYEHENGKNKPLAIKATQEVFIVEDILQGIKRLAWRKEQDIDGLQVGHLKWGSNILAPCICCTFNEFRKEGFIRKDRVFIAPKDQPINA